MKQSKVNPLNKVKNFETDDISLDVRKDNSLKKLNLESIVKEDKELSQPLHTQQMLSELQDSHDSALQEIQSRNLQELQEVESKLAKKLEELKRDNEKTLQAKKTELEQNFKQELTRFTSEAEQK